MNQAASQPLVARPEGRQVPARDSDGGQGLAEQAQLPRERSVRPESDTIRPVGSASLVARLWATLFRFGCRPSQARERPRRREPVASSGPTRTGLASTYSPSYTSGPVDPVCAEPEACRASTHSNPIEPVAVRPGMTRPAMGY